MSNEKQAIRLLIADDSEETRTSLRKLMALEDGIEVIGEAASGLEAVEKTRALSPHVVLMDVRMPEADGFSATETIVADMPNVQVIMMSVAGTAEVLRRAMMAGAREFLVKPFEPDDLVASIRRAYELYEPGEVYAAPTNQPEPAVASKGLHEGTVVAVFGPKGGVGRTTVACNLAVALAKRPHTRVMLVDGCLRFGDVGLSLHLRSELSIADLAPIEADDIELDTIEDTAVSHQSGLRVLLSPPTPERGDTVAPQAVRRILAELRRGYDFVVVDVSPAMNETDLAVLDVADRIVMLFTTELTALKDVRLFLDLAKALAYPRDKMIMVANRVEEAGGVRIADAETSLRFKTAICIRNDPKLATMAMNKGVPFALSHGHSSLAQSIEELAALVTPEGEPSPTSTARAGKAKKGGRLSLVPGGRGKQAVA